MIDRRSFIKSFGFGLAAVTVAPVVVLKTVVKPSAPPVIPVFDPVHLMRLYPRYAFDYYPLSILLKNMGVEIATETSTWKTWEEDWYKKEDNE